MNYPFIQIRQNDIPRPYLQVTIINPNNNQVADVIGLIDTGADECALPAFYAFILGHDLQRGFTKQISTGNGFTTAYSHTVNIKFNNILSGNVLIDFMPNLDTPLLGVKSFLSKFVLTIDYKNQQFSLV